MNFVNGLTEVIENDLVDAVIVADWTMRNVGKIPWVKDYKKIYYFYDLLSDWDFKRHINEYIYVKFEEELNRKSVDFVKVRIPTDDDLKLPHKAENFCEEDRKKWLANEISMEVDSTLFNKFNQDRINIMSNFAKSNGQVFYLDYKSKYFNFLSKQRIIPNQLSDYDNTIYLFGPCMVAGLYNPDNQTVAYYLQKQLLEKGLSYRVVAYGVPNDANRFYFPSIFNDENMKKGDVVVLMETAYRIAEWDIDLLDLFIHYKKEYYMDFYYDNTVHTGRIANRGIAEVLEQKLTYRKRLEVVEEKKDIIDIVRKDTKKFDGNLELQKYKDYIKSEAIHKKTRVGAIVMNCNPFTLGHQYLIEYASKQVDVLYIFIVEEDKSVFKFVERKEMVILGTAHLDNVKVLDSGRFIISSTTFSEYFEKSNIQGVTIDPSLDIETFAEHIAPILDISVRFVGTEPHDLITKQYNESMKRILPKYGIELIEVPRKEHENKAISASRVRDYMSNGEWGELSEIVPKTTYDYLYAKYREI